MTMKVSRGISVIYRLIRYIELGQHDGVIPAHHGHLTLTRDGVQSVVSGAEGPVRPVCLVSGSAGRARDTARLPLLVIP